MTQKTVLVTGTSTGIGEATVSRMAQAGWRVYAGVRKIADDAATQTNVTPVVLDVTNNDDIERVLARIDQETGSLHGLVNNAGVAVGGPVELLRDDEWRHQFDVNVFGLISLTKQAFPLIERADGRFVHVGSISGRITAAGLGPYAASKHALEAFNWSLRQELTRNTKMTSSLIEPGYVNTPIWGKAGDLIADLTTRLTEAGLMDRYGFLLAGQDGFVDEGQSKGVSPDAVAQVIERALTDRRPKVRYLVGTDAKGGGVITRVLPDRVLEAALGLNQKRLERSKKH